mmetsp:Transcript_149049/g.273616  ORF Transcript_149049/g.273616 Transcript_149049/m.273616 type:complete len:388 (+) Transcript_149049:64-1227(+)
MDAPSSDEQVQTACKKACLSKVDTPSSDDKVPTEIMVSVSHAASGGVLLERQLLASTTTLDMLADLVSDPEEQQFLAQSAIVGEMKIPLQGSQTIAVLGNASCESLDVSIAREPKCARLRFQQISNFTKVRGYVRELHIQSDNDADEPLDAIVEKFPGLESLTIMVGTCQRSGDASYWKPLKGLTHLKSLAVCNHHGARSSGALGHAFLQSLVDWGNDGPKLISLKYEGAMSLSLRFFEDWVDRVETLSEDLDTLSIQYWFANPPLVNDAIFKKITKKWQGLRHIHLGSGCHVLSDRAFTYFQDNAENIQAGLNLEKLVLVCCTEINGVGWLQPDSVKRNLPKLREFELSASRQFCKCDARSCGARVQVKDDLEKMGVRFNHHTTHW